jgi:hypothetical protein
MGGLSARSSDCRSARSKTTPAVKPTKNRTSTSWCFSGARRTRRGRATDVGGLLGFELLLPIAPVVMTEAEAATRQAPWQAEPPQSQRLSEDRARLPKQGATRCKRFDDAEPPASRLSACVARRYTRFHDVEPLAPRLPEERAQLSEERARLSEGEALLFLRAARRCTRLDDVKPSASRRSAKGERLSEERAQLSEDRERRCARFDDGEPLASRLLPKRARRNGDHARLSKDRARPCARFDVAEALASRLSLRRAGRPARPEPPSSVRAAHRSARWTARRSRLTRGYRGQVRFARLRESSRIYWDGGTVGRPRLADHPPTPAKSHSNLPLHRFYRCARPSRRPTVPLDRNRPRPPIRGTAGSP